MSTFVKTNRVLAVIIVLSIICAALLVGMRAGEESENKNVTMIMTYRDVRKFSLEADIPVEEALSAFADMGITGIVVENYWYFFPENEINNVKAAGLEPILRTVRDITVEEYDALCEKYDIEYPLYFSYRYLVGDADEYLKENGITLALVENKDQTGHEKIRNIDFGTCDVPMVRVFELIKSFASRYAVLGYEGAEEIENVLYRAVSDRNIRILWITPFYDSRTGDMITDLDEYRGVFENLAERMKPHGLRFDGDFSSVTTYDTNTFLVLACFFGIAAISVVLLSTLVRLSSKIKLALSLVLGALSVLAWIVMRELSLKIMAFVIVSVMPCIAVYYLVYRLKALDGTNKSFWRTLLYAVFTFLCVIVILLVGGSFVGGILGESRYMLEFEMFRGVKLSQMIPLVYTAVIIVKDFIYAKGKSVRTLVLDLGRNASKSKKLIALLGAVVLLGAVALFIVRTGNTILQAGALEQRFRIFFEETCIARPRTKEFLIAWPALVLAVFLFSRGKKILGSVALFASSIGCASVCNTFCHIRAYYLLSVIRTGYGAAIGLVLGAVAAALLYALLRVAEKGETNQNFSQKNEKKC